MNIVHLCVRVYVWPVYSTYMRILRAYMTSAHSFVPYTICLVEADYCV